MIGEGEGERGSGARLEIKTKTKETERTKGGQVKCEKKHVLRHLFSNIELSDALHFLSSLQINNVA